MGLLLIYGTAVVQWLRCCATIGSSLVRSQLVSLEFFIDIKSFRSHYTEMSTTSISWGLRRPVRKADVMKSGNLNFLEPSGSLQACNETAVPLVISGKQFQTTATPPKKCTIDLYSGGSRFETRPGYLLRDLWFACFSRGP